MKALLTETIGTFFLVLTVGLSVNANTELAAVAIGFSLMVMVYAGGRISGGHYNPAVSLAAMFRGALPSGKLVPYWAAQFVGGVLAAFLVWKFTGHALHVAPAESTSMLKALTGEAVFTFALAYVVLHTATGRGTENNSYFGLAIGSTVVLGAITMGPISGGAFNPAVGLAPAIVELVLGRAVSPLAWVYAAGPLAGAAAAAYVFKFQDAQDA